MQGALQHPILLYGNVDEGFDVQDLIAYYLFAHLFGVFAALRLLIGVLLSLFPRVLVNFGKTIILGIEEDIPGFLFIGFSIDVVVHLLDFRQKRIKLERFTI